MRSWSPDECAGATGEMTPATRFAKAALPLAILAAFALGGAAFAHTAERGFVLLLPTGYYLAGGTFAVAASFLLLAAVPGRAVDGAFAAERPLLSLPRIAPTIPGTLTFALLALLVLAGLYGSRDPLRNPLPLFVWTVWWVGFTLLQALAGDLWALVNPWSGPLRLGRRLLGLPQARVAPLRYPERLGYLPAIVLFFGFAWFELVDLAPSDPARLAAAVVLYWFLTASGIALFGEERWLSRAEPFTIFFRLVGRLSPVVVRPDPARPETRVSVSLAWPGRALIDEPALPLTGVLFVLLTLSSVSFDGLSRTFLWLSLFDINPLEFPGRSAVVGINTAGLALAFAALAGAFLGAVALGSALAGRKPIAIAGRLVYSILPISLAFHAAHYLPVLLVDGQYAILAAADPFARGWDLLGIGHRHPTTSFLNNLDDVTVLWNVQTAIICVGHIVGIALAHAIALRDGGARTAAVGEAPLAALMVLYTAFGLWLLATPTAG
jgi:hypothetical protein